MLYCAVLRCAVLCCAVLYSGILELPYAAKQPAVCDLMWGRAIHCLLCIDLDCIHLAFLGLNIEMDFFFCFLSTAGCLTRH